MGEKECVVKLNSKEESVESPLYCHSRWLSTDGDLHLTLMDPEGAIFSLSMTSEQMQQLTDQLRIDVAAWAKEAFVKASPQHVFSLSKSTHAAEMIWRRQEGSSRAKVRVGSFKAHRPEDAAAARQQLLDALIARGEEEAEARQELADKCIRVEKDLEKAR